MAAATLKLLTLTAAAALLPAHVAFAAVVPTLDATSFLPAKPTVEAGLGGNWGLNAHLSDAFTGEKGSLGTGINANLWMDGFFEADTCSIGDASNGLCTNPVWHGPAPSAIKGANIKKKSAKKAHPLTFVISKALKVADAPLFQAANDALSASQPEDCECGEQYGGFTNGLLRSRSLWQPGPRNFLEAQISFPDVADVKGSLWLQNSNMEVSIDITKDGIECSAHTFGSGEGHTATAEHAVTVGTGKHTYGLQWPEGGNDLEVYFDGERIATLAGADWNPSGEAAEGFNVMVDYAPHNPPEDFAAPAAAMSLHYLAAFEPRASTAAPATTTTAQASVQCTMLKKAGVAYSGPIVAKFNNADGATAITDPDECAQKCAENPECTYFSVNKARSKGCVLKSNRRGSPVKSSAYLGHGTCEHAVPASCQQLGTSQGHSKFKKNNLGSFRNIKNAGGCAQKCEATPGCSYWLVNNRAGCVLNHFDRDSEGNLLKAGRFLTGKKGYMAYGTCSPAGAGN